jgi:hypothetical protein
MGLTGAGDSEAMSLVVDLPGAAPRHHAVITGTGRAGTTFLVELLTLLGLDTGFQPRELAQRKSTLAQAGLELDVRRSGMPYIVKAPAFCDYAEQVYARPDIVIDHVFVPMRELHQAAESRRRVMGLHLAGMTWWRRLKVWIRRKELAGGLVGTRRADDQAQVLQDSLYRLLLATAAQPVGLTLLQFPRLVHDSAYLYDKLQPVLQDVSFERFDRVHRQLAQPTLVHRFEPPRPTERLVAA